MADVGFAESGLGPFDHDRLEAAVQRDAGQDSDEDLRPNRFGVSPGAMRLRESRREAKKEPDMAFIRTVMRYSAFLYPNSGEQAGRINLYCGPERLYILFLDPSDTLLDNAYNESTTTGVAYQTFDQYQYYLDLVRNEKPIYVTFRPEDDPPNYVVYSANEPPGEGEI